MPIVVIFLIILALIFNILNGVMDSCNLVATAISSRALNPKLALFLAAIAGLIGPLIFGVAVATTIGSEIVDAQHINLNVLLAALLAAIIWNVLTWRLGIPSSSMHALIGGLIGAIVVRSGFSVLRLPGILKIVIALFASPLIGFIAGWVIANVAFMLSWKSHPKINNLYKRLQIFTTLALALSHGTNDAQKTMGVITLGLLISNQISEFIVPTWVILACASAMAVGTSIGGWNLIKTLGSKFYRVRPIHAFSSQISSSLVVLAASLLGGPVSTTQVVSTSIMGVGAAERANKVRWGVAGEILTAWLLTIPTTALLAAGLFWFIEKALPAIINLF